MTSAIVLQTQLKAIKQKPFGTHMKRYTKVAQFALNFISCNNKQVCDHRQSYNDTKEEANEINVTTCKTKEGIF